MFRSKISLLLIVWTAACDPVDPKSVDETSLTTVPPPSVQDLVTGVGYVENSDGTLDVAVQFQGEWFAVHYNNGEWDVENRVAATPISLPPPEYRSDEQVECWCDNTGGDRCTKDELIRACGTYRPPLTMTEVLTHRAVRVGPFVYDIEVTQLIHDERTHARDPDAELRITRNLLIKLKTPDPVDGNSWYVTAYPKRHATELSDEDNTRVDEAGGFDPVSGGAVGAPGALFHRGNVEYLPEVLFGTAYKEVTPGAPAMVARSNIAMTEAFAQLLPGASDGFDPGARVVDQNACADQHYDAQTGGCSGRTAINNIGHVAFRGTTEEGESLYEMSRHTGMIWRDKTTEIFRDRETEGVPLAATDAENWTFFRESFGAAQPGSLFASSAAAQEAAFAQSSGFLQCGAAPPNAKQIFSFCKKWPAWGPCWMEAFAQSYMEGATTYGEKQCFGGLLHTANFEGHLRFVTAVGGGVDCNFIVVSVGGGLQAKASINFEYGASIEPGELRAWTRAYSDVRLQAYLKVRVLWVFGGTWAVTVGASRGRTHTLFQAEKVVHLLPDGLSNTCTSDPDNYCEDPSAACTGDGQCVKFQFAPGANGNVEGRPIVTGACLQRSQQQPGQKYVRLVYLVPKDVTENPVYKNVVERSAKFVRRWYRDQMATQGAADTKSFVLHPSGVQVVKTDHPDSWYSTHGTAGQYQWWDNVRDDAFRLAGGQYNDPNNIWIYFIDSHSPCNQTGGAGTNGVAILPANDLRGLAGEPLRVCPNGYEVTSKCRWLGGLAHEMGHAMGLPHPMGCDQNTAACTQNSRDSLMWLGYLDIGKTYLLPENFTALKTNPYFFAAKDTTPLGNCEAP